MTDWKTIELGQVSTLQRGMDLPKRMRIEGDYPIVTSSGIDDTHSIGPIKGPGVITGRYGTIGRVFFVESDFWPLNTTLYVRDFHGNDPRFIHYLLQTVDFQSHSGKSGVPGVNRNDVHQEFVHIPADCGEQKAIAQTLLDADVLIDSLQQLLTKKRQIKQGAMQELLTGKRRLPGFTSDWEARRIGSFAPLQRGFDLPSRARRSGPHPVVYSNGVLNFHNEYRVKGPGVVTGRSGTIGAVTFVEQDYWPHNTALWVTNFNSCDPKFVFYLFQYIGLERFATGSGVPTLNRNDVHSFEVLVPASIDEQAMIATVLDDMDADISALESRLTKAHSLKQAMAQALLTGRIRLVEPDASRNPPGATTA